ncbi:hypothetical protein JTE90_023659 [Oedothorax gibbosus]|uniref:BZIP domain-containing protein n=1 Tax=Oedothorax gibbosus TaxID=931172 RepID=A0AAV6UZ27_9ARAC|nr:hypothetical protein JTE90_023659 [Oedothorax gibbosus]
MFVGQYAKLISPAVLRKGLVVDQQINKETEQESSTLFRVSNMVEQEKLQVSPAFPGSQNSGVKLQDAFNNPWFMIDSTALLNDKSISSSGGLLEDNFSYVLQGVIPKEINDSYLEKLSNAEYANKLSEFSQPKSEMFPTASDSYFEVNSPLSFWGTCPLDLDTIKLDDVFQVDKDELFQSPTLAELNANDESLFDSFDCFDHFLPNENKTLNKQMSGSDLITDYNMSAFNTSDQPKEADSYSKVSESIKQESASSQDGLSQEKEMSCKDFKNSDIKPKNDSSLHDTLQGVPFSVDSKKTKKNLKQNHDTHFKVYKDAPLQEDSVEKCLKKLHELPSTSLNDNSDTDEDSEMDAEYSTDADDFSEDEGMLYSSKYTAVNKGNHEKKRSRYFWQYNMQSKGPKGPKLKLAGKFCNVHDVKRVGDPIFNKNCPIDGIKHSGKARRGDGNDLTPNPKKLHSIGRELDKLNQIIEGLVPVNELPMNARTKSRKEKNKLASRACRLKKKAQHEANKLKLFGLQEEQKHLLMLTKEVKKLIKWRMMHTKQSKPQSILAAIEALQKNKAAAKVAGCSADFVNDVLKHVGSGEENGGLMVAPEYED